MGSPATDRVVPHVTVRTSISSTSTSLASLSFCRWRWPRGDANSVRTADPRHGGAVRPSACATARRALDAEGAPRCRSRLLSDIRWSASNCSRLRGRPLTTRTTRPTVCRTIPPLRKRLGRRRCSSPPACIRANARWRSSKWRKRCSIADIDARFALVGPDEGEGAVLSEGAQGRPAHLLGRGALARCCSRTDGLRPVCTYCLRSASRIRCRCSKRCPSVCPWSSAVRLRTCPARRADPQRNCHRPRGTGVGERGRVDPRGPVLARTMGERGRATVRTEFTMRTVGDRLVSAYTDVLEGNR